MVIFESELLRSYHETKIAIEIEAFVLIFYLKKKYLNLRFSNKDFYEITFVWTGEKLVGFRLRFDKPLFIS